MSRIYEGMFLIDNDAVRTGWPAAKSIVTDLIAKHGGAVETARRWAERPLAYPIKRRRRATYLLVHFTIGRESISAFHRDLEINESVLRYLQLAVDEVPAKERELAAEEQAPEFVVPEPPADDSTAAEAETDEAEGTPAAIKASGKDDDDDDDDDEEALAVGTDGEKEA